MKYTMVKQFSNAALDNAFKFVYKIIDFFKVLYEALWAFIEIWATFFSIFGNMFLYVYYLMLFLIDRGADEGGALAFWKRRKTSISKTPNISLTSDSNPIPAMYRTSKSSSTSAPSMATASPSSAISGSSSARFTGGSTGGKRSIFKTIGEAVANFFVAIGKGIAAPFKAIILFFDNKLKPVKEGSDDQQSSKKSLIEEYLKEYEQGKN
jgi:hypothetical protein